MDRCPVCGTLGANQLVTFADRPDFLGRNCPRCGPFYISDRAAAILPNLIARKEINASRLSHDLRVRFDESKAKYFLGTEELRPYKEDLAYVSPQEQLDNLILWIGRNQGPPHAWVEAALPRVAAIIGAAVSSDNNNVEPGLTWILRAHENSRLLSLSSDSKGQPARYQLKPEGWKYFQELSRRVVNGRNAFMAMKFNDADLTRVLNECFKPAAHRAGFTLRPLNDAPSAGLIDNQIRAAIRTARFVVADLTHDNNGAYFEAGFAEGLGVPVIYTCEAQKFHEKKTHFDTNHMHTVPWDINKLADASRDLTATIRNTLPAAAKFDE